MSLRLMTFGGLTLERDSRSVSGPGGHRNALALAAILARAGRRGVSRDSLAALLWPESDTERARNALRQTVYVLRAEAGEAAVVGKQQLVLHDGVVRSDVGEFEAAIERGDLATAMDLYRGPFLDGFFLRGSAEFEQWVDQERNALARSYCAVLEELATRAEAAGEHERAVRLWRQRVAEEPLSSRVTRRLMEALATSGDAPGALRVARDHEDVVREELGCEPDPELRAVVAALSMSASAVNQAGADRGPATDNAPAPSAVLGADLIPRDAPAEPGAVRTRTGRFTTARVLATCGVAAVILLLALGIGAPQPVVDEDQVAVYIFENVTGDSAFDGVGRIAADWIRQGLSQTGLVDVTPMGLDGWLGEAGDGESRADSIPAFVASGLLYRQADSLVLQATVTDHKGRQIGALDPVVTAAGAPLEGVERLRQQVMSLLATHLNEDLTAWATAGRQPTSFAAYQAFAAGMEAYARGETGAAREHFVRSAGLDPEYVLPLLWASYVGGGPGLPHDSIDRLLTERRARLTPFESALLDYNIAWWGSDTEAAYHATRRLIDIAPQSEWLYLHGRMAFGNMRPYEAIEVLLRADPARGWLAGTAARGYWTTLASAFKQTGQYERALETARRGQEDFPGDRSLLPLLEGAALAALGRTSELDSLRETLLFWDVPEARQDLPLAWPIGWAQELIAHGDEPQGLEMLKWTMDLYRRMPAEMRAQFPKRIEYARMLWIARRYPEARDSLARLAAERPGHYNVRLRLAMAAARSGDTATARATLDWLEGSGDWPLEPYWRFCILASLGRSEEALVILREYPHLRFHSWSGTHIDYAYPLMHDYPAFLDAVAPRDGPAEWEVSARMDR